MDYDDNDFQSQNFQLSADDNKFPLPKFDIDDHLQVNLRFDSLVDTDILLGIQNQDNNWIEDFSSGTSAIEFNSSAAKTHTISRHTNVWSEATSSESVEMLLKSVGEDEMNNNKAIAMESDLQNASNNLINPVDPTLENDNDSSVMATFVQDDQSLQPVKVERNISDQNTDASREMLLKSVVEDEINNDKPIAIESDNSDLENASNYLTSPVDPTVEIDNDSSAMVTFVQDDQSVQPDEVERDTLDQNTDVSGEMLPKSVGEDEMNNNKPIVLESDLRSASNNPISPVNPTPENDNDMATIVQGNPSLQPDKVERNISDQNTDASEEMLLKSVGEDETNNNEPADNTDLENASSYLINPVDPTPENDNDSSTMAIFVQDYPSLQPDGVETNISDQKTDASEEARQCPESASDVFACHSDLNKGDSQTVSLPSVEPTMDSFVLVNDGCDVSEISENRDDLLEVVACQVEVSNASEAVETAGEKHTGIINQNEKEFGNIEAAREVISPVDTNNPKTPKKFTVIENITGCGHSKIDMQIHETETAVENRVEFNIVENDEECGSKLIQEENAAQSISYESVHNTTEDVAASVSTAAGNLKSNVFQVDKAEVTISESEDRTDSGHSEIDMQTHETEAVVEKSVEVNIAENDEESWSKLIPQEKAAQSVSYKRIQSTTEDAAVPVSTDAANLNSIVYLMDKSEATTSESEDAHMTDVGSGFGVPSAEESTDKVKSHIDGPLSENRSSEQKEMTSPKSQAYDFIDADAKEIKNSEDVQVSTIKNSAAPDLVLEQSASEVSDHLSSEWMNLNERKTSIIANSEFTQLEGNVDNRRSEDPNSYENKLPHISQLNIIEVQHSGHVESSDGSQCKFELQSLPDKSDASPHANLQTIFGEFSSHRKENILSTPSSSAAKPPITQGGSAVVDEHIVSEQEKYEKFDKSASPDANMQTVSRYCSYGELPIHSEECILPTPSSSAVKPPITQGDSPVIEHIVSGNEKCRSDKSDASPDANVQTISNISGCGGLPSHREEHILSTPSQSAVKPPITEVNTPMVEEHTVSEKEKDKSDKADVSPDANMRTVSNIAGYGELLNLSEENIPSTPSSSAVKPPITQGDSLMVEEHDVSEKENYELPSQSEKTVMSEFSPSAVKPPITQRDSPVVEEPIGFEEKYKSDKSDASPCSNMQTVSSNSDYGELPIQSKENIMSTPSSSAVKLPIMQVDSPMVEEHIVCEEEKFKSDKLDASPGANIQTASSISGELPNYIEENILSTPSLSAVKPLVTPDDSPVVEEHVCEKKYKSDKSDATLDVNMHTISSIHGELPSYSEESILSTPSSLAVKPPIEKGDSPVVEDHIVSEEEKYKCDKSGASLDANMQTVSSISGEFPSHSEEHILSTPSSSAVKPSITQGDSPVVEEHTVFGEEKYTSDKSETSADANMHIVSSVSGYGEMPSHREKKILLTPSSSVVKLKPPIAQGDSPVVEEQIVFEKEKYKSDNLEASPNANTQTVSSNSGELLSHSKGNILSTSPSAVKPPNTQGGFPVVEEHIVSKREKDKSDYSNESPDVNKHSVSGVSGEFSIHSGKNVMPTPSPSDVKPSGYKIDAIKQIIPDSNKRIATEDDKGFSFEIRKGSDMSDNNTVNQMKSFPDASSSESPKTPIEITKGTSEKKSTKPRARSTKGTPTRKKSTESAGISCTTPASAGTVSSAFQLDEVKLKAESSRKRKFGSPIIQTSSLPDLNSSVSASTLVHQPFSDTQQVQLRAQIFVYGSLIQGIPPDEACMQSAFGDKDGGKSTWETVWRKSVDRCQTQKSPVNQETPLLSHSVVRTPNQETKCSSSQSKVSDTSASKFVGKPIAPAIPSTPLSAQSPVWNMTPNFPRAMQLDFNKASTPLHPYPSSQTRQFTNNSSPWLASNPRPAQWASQSPVLKSATQYSSVLAVDTVKVTPIRESSMPHNSFIPSPVPVSIPLESQGKTASAQKSRKRKKALVIEDISKTILVSQITPTSIVPRSLPTLLPIAPLTTNTPLKVTTEPIVETFPHVSPPTASSSCQITNTVNDAQLAKFSEETGNKVQHAKLHAEEAASIAASVVSHGQGIWNQIAARKNSSVPIEVETKLASVAAAAAAAASVAKAAASAAKVAFEAVVQAKVMADEAINAAKTGNNVQYTGANFDATKNLAMLTPGSILKGKDKMHGSSTIISAACDAAQKRVEEASAASKRAENLNAIMKAAELAAEAVSHVGTIIAMGDPLPFKLSELVEAGPEGSWKSFNKANKLKELEQPEKASISDQETQQTALKNAEQPDEAEDNCDGSERRVGKSSTLSNDGHEKGPSIPEENAFRKGSLVEVISDEDGLKGGWFSARVLDVADKKVHVCYNNLLSDDGPEQLKEWVSLNSEINGAPRIRIAHPGIVTKNEGTKKRRREATDNYVWEIGDHVDAWMRDGWWEGIITEKNQLDETKLTVHFPAGGDSSLVRAWDLRTSLSWKDGQWTEWSRAEASKPHESDTPQEKRRKLTQLETKTDAKADGKVANKEPSSKIPEMAEASRPLNLSTKDTIFSFGKKEDNKSEAFKGKRTGPHKEGLGVVFGVPKGPGKKQKFMEVSKHYSTDKSNHGKEKDSLKFPKYLMPQPSQPWRNTSKVDSRGKRAVDFKSTSVKSTRVSNSNARNVKQKDSSNNTSVTSASNDENPDKNYRDDSVSSRPGSTESLVAAPNTSKKKPSSVNDGDRGVKRRFTPSSAAFRSEKKTEASEGENSDANEPRRSTRKIQPTSRLLEGLQSSMMMSRIPSFSQGKSSKTYHRSSSSRGKNRG